MYGKRVRVLAAAALAGALGSGAVAACSDGGGGTGPGPGPTTGSVVAQVSAAGGSGVSGAAVGISGGAAQSTGSDGRARFDNLQPGSYTLTLQQLPAGFSMGGETAGKAANVTAGGTATVSWSVQGGAGGNTRTVEASGASFSPSSVTIPVGGTVNFQYVSGGPHTVTPENPTGNWTERTFTSTSDNFSVTFNTAGTYRYRCVPHSSSFSSGMVGVIVVQ